jgi:hypothetical protein
MRALRRRAPRSDVDRQLSGWSRRRTISWTFFGLALLVAGQHLLAHAGLRPMPMSMARQDIFFGYPAAFVLAIAGGLTMDPNPRL